jgi:hypothetical protein
MDRTALADKGGPELVKHLIDLQQDPPEFLGVDAVV